MTATQLKTTRKLLGLYLSECSRVTTFPASTINAMELGRTPIRVTQAKTLRRRLHSECLRRIDQLTKLAGELGRGIPLKDYAVNLSHENKRLREWIKAEGERTDTCTFDVIRKVCDGCRCKRAAKNTP